MKFILLERKPQEQIFDTLIDTNKIYVSIKCKFKPRSYKNKDGKSPLYLHVSSKGNRLRVHSEIWVDTKKFNCAKQQVFDFIIIKAFKHLDHKDYLKKIYRVRIEYES